LLTRKGKRNGRTPAAQKEVFFLSEEKKEEKDAPGREGSRIPASKGKGKKKGDNPIFPFWEKGEKKKERGNNKKGDLPPVEERKGEKA